VSSRLRARVSPSAALRTPWTWLPHAAVGLIALPFIVHQNSWYEWANSLWLLDLQTAHVAAHGLPTYFIDAPEQYFYPNFVFYGGTAFSLLAYPSLVFGTWPVFAASTVAAFIATSAGLSWTARNLGVPPRLAIIPGVLFALTPYTVSNLYGRGAWSELVAVGALSVALGAATSLTSGRAGNRPAMVVVLALAVAGVAGTHNITLLFSALMAPLLGLALLPLLTGTRRQLIHRHLLVLAGTATGVAICGVFLIPDIWLSGRTIASTISHSFLRQLTGFDSFSTVFDPTLGQPHLTVPTDLHTQTLLIPLVWLIVVCAIAARRRWLQRGSAVSLALIGVAVIGLAALITHPSWWLSLPSAVQAIQFPFRLVSYLALFTGLGVIALLRIPAVQRSRLALGALVLACGWQAGLAADLALTAKARGGQPHPVPTPSNVSAAAVPTAFAAGLLQASRFRLVVTHPLSPPGPGAQVAPVEDDTPPEIVLSGSQPPATLVATHVVATPLIHVTGQVSVAGTSPDGFEVLRVDKYVSSTWHARIAPACSSCLRALTGHAPLALLAGKLTSLIGVMALFGWMVAGTRTRARRGRSRGASHRPPS
jgi:hypothetical protein